MKKNAFLFVIFLMTSITTHKASAQNDDMCVEMGYYCGGSLGEFAIKYSKRHFTEPKIKNLVVDEKNLYVFQSAEGLIPDAENLDKMVKVKQYRSFGVWKATSDITSIFTVIIDAQGNVATTDAAGMFFLGFNNGMPLGKIYDEEAVKTAFKAKFDNITARGAEGTEIMYAEIPQVGTTIGLFIVLGSEIKSNNGKPKWKMKVGNLVFDKGAVGGWFEFIPSK
jgi:hypothetical protein